MKKALSGALIFRTRGEDNGRRHRRLQSRTRPGAGDRPGGKESEDSVDVHLWPEPSFFQVSHSCLWVVTCIASSILPDTHCSRNI